MKKQAQKKAAKKTAKQRPPYTLVPLTDGFRTTTQYVVNGPIDDPNDPILTDPHLDGWRGWMLQFDEFLAKIESITNAYVRPHAEEMREIVRRLERLRTELNYTNAEYKQIERIGELMSKIVALLRVEDDGKRIREMEPLAKTAIGFKKSQSNKARLPRIKVGEAGSFGEAETVGDIIAGLAARTDELGDQLSADDLWGEFFSELDSLGLHPEEHEDPNDKDKTRIEYDFKDRRRPIGFRTFENRLAMIRKSR